MQRYRRFSRVIPAALAYANDVLLPLGPFGYGAKFNDGATADPLAADPPADPPTPPPAPAAPPAGFYPAAQYRETEKRRKKYTTAFQGIIRKIAPDVDMKNVKVRFTSDPENPVVIDGIPDLDVRLNAASTIAQASGTSRRSNQAAPQVSELQAQNAALRRMNAALVDYVKHASIIQPMRAACMRHGAVDDHNGQFTDIVNFLSPRAETNVEIDPEDDNAPVAVSIVVKDENGNPAVDPKTSQPLTIDQMVEQFLTRYPKYRSTNYRPGPGAGGAGMPVRRNGVVVSNGQATNRTAKAIGNYFGMPVETVESMR